MKRYTLLIILSFFLSLFAMSCNNHTDKDTTLTSTEISDQKIKTGPKSVLIVSSSPRRDGNSETLCMQFKKGAEEAGHRVEMVNINDYNIHYFDRTEYIRGEEETFDDDAMIVINKMKAADVIVLASPVYFYSMTGQMKTLIDRTYNHEKDLGEKEFYYIITSTDRDAEALDGTIEGFRGFARCLYKSVERGIVRGNGARERGAILKHPAMQEAYELGKNV